MSRTLNALRVDAVDEDALRWGPERAETWRAALPVQAVRLPVDDADRCAVLSWRWDVRQGDGFSPNAWLALRRARQLGVRRLFMDVVSIDQSLRGDDLLQEVVAFSDLYQRLPVIAAYDDPAATTSFEWFWTMRRPWILREVRALRANPHRVHYVGYLPLQGAHDDNPVGHGELPVDRFHFVRMLRRVWTSSFTHSILGVLCGIIGMHEPGDLRFIMPEHAAILAAAHAQLGRNDFLLLAGILSNASAPNSKVNAEADITGVQLERLALRRADGGTYDDNRDILFDGERIATWRSHLNLATSNTHSYLESAPDAERIVFAALGLSDADYRRYEGRAEQRRGSLLLSADASTPLPAIDVVRLSR